MSGSAIQSSRRLPGRTSRHLSAPRPGSFPGRRRLAGSGFVLLLALSVGLVRVASAEPDEGVFEKVFPPVQSPPRSGPPAEGSAWMPSVVESPPSQCLSVVQIEIYKWKHLLRATCDEGAVLEFPIALGRRPFGDKQRQGDMRTPEGHYRIAEPPRPSRFHVFMALDYPSAVDADRALSRGEIESETYLAIVRALLRGALPPQDTVLGGAIGIHGEGSDNRGRSREEDWTLGCIALRDGDARFLAERIDVGTPVVIRP